MKFIICIFYIWAHNCGLQQIILNWLFEKNLCHQIFNLPTKTVRSRLVKFTWIYIKKKKKRKV